MRAVWRVDVDVADERDTGEHVASAIAEVAATVDDSYGEAGVFAEKDEHRLGDEAVEGTGYAAIGLTSVWLAVRAGVEIECEEDVGFDDFAVPAEFDRGVQDESEVASRLREFGFGELEDEMNGFPEG